MTARPSIARLVVISPAAVVVLLIGLWAILGTWQDEAAARAAASERTSHDRSGREDARNVVSIARGTGSEFTWNDRGHLVTNYDVVRVRLGRASAVERRTRCAVLAGRLQHIGRFVRLTVLRDGRNTDLSVTLQAGQQEVRLGASYSKSA